MKYQLYNNIRLYRIARATILALRGQSISEAVGGLTGLSAPSFLNR